MDVVVVFCVVGLWVFCCLFLVFIFLVAFALRSMYVVIGIVVTVSYNSCEYNGYKVYWEDGIQIVLFHDCGIVAVIVVVDFVIIFLEIDGIEFTLSMLERVYCEVLRI